VIKVNKYASAVLDKVIDLQLTLMCCFFIAVSAIDAVDIIAAIVAVKPSKRNTKPHAIPIKSQKTLIIRGFLALYIF